MLKKSGLLAIFLLVISAFVNAQTSTFTYQGLLSDGGYPAAGTYQMTFELFDSLSGGSQVGSPITNDTVSVINGRFTVLLDFGSSAFATGAGRWLQISVNKASETSVTVLSPRQALTSSPYSIKTLSATTADSLSPNCVGCVVDANIGDVAGAKVTGTVANAATAGHADTATNSNALGGSPSSSFLRTTGGLITGNLTVSGGRYFGNGSALTGLPNTGLTWQEVTAASVQAIPNRGYIASSSVQVEVTLPAAPIVGDVVRVSGGLSSWKVNQNAGQTITSDTFANSTGRWSALNTAQQWVGVAMSADGEKLIAVPYNGKIVTSIDGGNTWTERDSQRYWNGVASSADGTKLFAWTAFSFLYTSTDSGVTWTPRDAGKIWKEIAPSADGTKLLARAETGNTLYTSTDSGITWTPRETLRWWSAVASSADGTRLTAADSNGYIYVSTDSGITWTPRAPEKAWTALASSADGMKLVGMATSFGGFLTACICTSTDGGLTWTERPPIGVWYNVKSSADGVKLISGGSNQKIYRSSDSGATWFQDESIRNWYSFASSADGRKLAATTYGGQIHIYSENSSTNGVTGYLTGTRSSAVELLYVGNGRFVVASSAGDIRPF